MKRHAKTLPVDANKNCIRCDKIFMSDEPCYQINKDRLGRPRCECITCFKRKDNGK